MNKREKLTVQQTVDVPLKKAWEIWTEPEHIKQWNSASEDWHTTEAENDLRAGGKFRSRMEAKDGSEGFDFDGTYDVVEPYEKIVYTMGDDRVVDITFSEMDNQTTVEESFDAEDKNPSEMQVDGWQAIMDHYKEYAESLSE